MGIWLDCKYKEKVGYLAPTAGGNPTIEDVHRERKAAELKEVELLESARRKREEQDRKKAEERLAAGNQLASLLARGPQSAAQS